MERNLQQNRYSIFTSQAVDLNNTKNFDWNNPLIGKPSEPAMLIPDP